MISALFSFFVGFALLLLIFVVLIAREKDKKPDIYFLIILSVAGAQRFFQGIESFELIESFSNPLVGKFSIQFFMFVVGYLFFVNLFNKNVPYKIIILHFVFPTFFAVTIKLFNLDIGLIKEVFFPFSSLYIVLVALLFRKFVGKRKNHREQLHFQSVKVWASMTFAIFIAIYILINYVSLSNNEETVSGIFVQFYNLTSIMWLVFIVYILKNPIILYGHQLLLKNLNTNSKEEVAVWRNAKLEPTELEDLELEKKVKHKVDEIIFAIKKFEEELLENFQALPTLKELAFQLDYPQSHLKYVFNYYSFCSFSEYQNNLKIKLALKLIKSGYLDTRTIDSLATRCLFTNRITFYRNFKKWVGYTPSEYQSQLSSPAR
jgi:AraC-like DNA-binding protein